jgi:hypothetical protein
MQYIFIKYICIIDLYMALKFDIEEPEERKKFIDSEAEAEREDTISWCDVVAMVSCVLICALIIFGLGMLIDFLDSLNAIEPEPVIQSYNCGPGSPVEWCPPPTSDDSSNSNSNSTYTPPASGNSSNSSNLTNLTVYNQTIDGNLTEYNQTIDGNLTEYNQTIDGNLTEFD